MKTIKTTRQYLPEDFYRLGLEKLKKKDVGEFYGVKSAAISPQFQKPHLKAAYEAGIKDLPFPTEEVAAAAASAQAASTGEAEAPPTDDGIEKPAKTRGQEKKRASNSRRRNNGQSAAAAEAAETQAAETQAAETQATEDNNKDGEEQIFKMAGKKTGDGRRAEKRESLITPPPPSLQLPTASPDSMPAAAAQILSLIGDGYKSIFQIRQQSGLTIDEVSDQLDWLIVNRHLESKISESRNIYYRDGNQPPYGTVMEISESGDEFVVADNSKSAPITVPDEEAEEAAPPKNKNEPAVEDTLPADDADNSDTIENGGANRASAAEDDIIKTRDTPTGSRSRSRTDKEAAQEAVQESAVLTEVSESRVELPHLWAKPHRWDKILQKQQQAQPQEEEDDRRSAGAGASAIETGEIESYQTTIPLDPDNKDAVALFDWRGSSFFELPAKSRRLLEQVAAAVEVYQNAKDDE